MGDTARVRGRGYASEIGHAGLAFAFDVLGCKPY